MMSNKDKSCEFCQLCRHNYSYCSTRDKLPNDIGERFVKDGIEYTKTCPDFEWD